MIYFPTIPFQTDSETQSSKDPVEERETVVEGLRHRRQTDSPRRSCGFAGGTRLVGLGRRPLAPRFATSVSGWRKTRHPGRDHPRIVVWCRHQRRDRRYSLGGGLLVGTQAKQGCATSETNTATVGAPFVLVGTRRRAAGLSLDPCAAVVAQFLE